MLGAGEACRPLASLPASAPCFPQGQRQVRCLFHWSGSWTSEGKGTAEGPSSPQDAGWVVPGVGALGAWGQSWVTPGVWVVLCRPFLSSRTVCPSHPPLQGQAALRPWGLIRKRGLGLLAPTAGQGLDPLLLRGPHRCPTCSLSPLLASSAGSRPAAAAGSRACVPGRLLCPPSPRSLRVAPGLGQSGSQ